MEVVKVSWDKLTIVGDIKNLLAFERLVNNSTHVNLIKNTQSEIKGFFLNDLVYFEYTPMRAKTLKVSNMRLEFNPNHLADYHKHILMQDILPLVAFKHLSRADLAFDLDTDLSRLKVHYKRNVKTKYYFSETNQLETLYLGSSTSERQLRMYNKKLERESNDDDSLASYKNYWRVEFQMRREAINSWQSILDDYTFNFDFDLSDIKNLADKLTLEALIDKRIAFSDIEKGKERERIRKLYKKLLAQDSDIKTLMQEAIKKEAQRLADELEELLHTNTNINGFNQIIS